MTGDLLVRAADTLPGLDYETWAFGDSVAFEALVAASRAAGRDRWREFARGCIRAWATRAEPYRRLDCTAPGLAMVQVYEDTGDDRVLAAAARLAGYLRSRPRIGGVFATWAASPLRHPYGPGRLDAAGAALLAAPPAGVFVDCLHFDPPFLTALGAVTGDRALLEEGVDQALGYVRLLQTGSGLFDHFVLDGSPRTYGPGWGRGQGWALLGLLDVLERLPGDHDRRPEVVAAARGLVRALLATQRPDGHWPVVLAGPAAGPPAGDPARTSAGPPAESAGEPARTSAGESTESSTAAFAAVGLRRAARLGVVGAGEVSAAAEAALAAVLRDTTADGILQDVSAAVLACTEPSHYAHVPRGFVVPWGQGPLVLALVEADRDGAR